MLKIDEGHLDTEGKVIFANGPVADPDAVAGQHDIADALGNGIVLVGQGAEIGIPAHVALDAEVPKDLVLIFEKILFDFLVYKLGRQSE